MKTITAIALNCGLCLLTAALFVVAVVLWDSRRPSACECERCNCRELGECVPPCRASGEPVE